MELKGTNKFSYLYNSEAESLKMNWLNHDDDEEGKMWMLHTFSTKFTVIPELLNTFLEYSKLLDNRLNWLNKFKNEIDEKFIFDNLSASRYKWSYFSRKAINPMYNFSYCFVSHKLKHILMVEESKQYLRFPLSSLAKHYEYIYRCSASPLSKELEEQYRQSLKLYQKIKNCELNNTEWLKCIREVNDVNFIIQNIECRVGERPEDKEMWKLYIRFLKNSKLVDMMYHTYYRYCCLFTDDLKMREEFKNEIKNSEDSFSQWKLKMVKIENNFGTPENAVSLFKNYFPVFKREIQNENFESEFQEAWEESKNERTNPLTKYTVDNNILELYARKSAKRIFKNDAIHQTFSLPSTAINFMLKNAKCQHLQKLYETSKYFYARLKSLVCYKIIIGVTPATVTFQQNLYISSDDKDDASETINKCHVKEMIHIQSTSPSILSILIKNKIHNCEISTLSLLEQEIYLEDFLQLVSTVENFIVDDSFVWNEEYQKISIPEMIAKMPSIKVAKFENCLPFPCNSKVPEMERKLELFECSGYQVSYRLGFSAPIMCKFLAASLTSNAIARVSYWADSIDEAELAKKCITEMFDLWKNDKSFKPNVKIRVQRRFYHFP